MGAKELAASRHLIALPRPRGLHSTDNQHCVMWLADVARRECVLAGRTCEDEPTRLLLSFRIGDLKRGIINWTIGNARLAVFIQDTLLLFK